MKNGDIKMPHLSHTIVFISSFLELCENEIKSFAVFSAWQFGHSACKLENSCVLIICHGILWSIWYVYDSCFLHIAQFHDCDAATFFFIVSDKKGLFFR